MKTARDLILELYKEDHITKEETDLLLDAIEQKGGTTFIPVPSEPHPPLNPYNPPYKQPDIWYTTGTTTTSDNKSDING
jgi:hypothetical protein